MKAIIPVAGVGSRLRPHTHTHPKALIPVAGKPILGHIIEKLMDSGINDMTFVIGYLGEKIMDYIESHFPGLKTSFIVQNERKGIGHAIWLTRDVIKDEKEVLIALGDTICFIDFTKFMKSKHSVIATKKVDDPRRFGVVEIDKNEFINKVVEKPTIPKSNWAIVGLYRIKEVPELLKGLEYIIKNNMRSHGEFHLTDAIMHMIENGVQIKKMDIDNWFDCGQKDALLETNSILLKNPELTTTRHKFENTIIIPPVNIPSSCKIQNSIIGPNVSIGDEAVIDSSIIRNSIIGPYAEIQNALLHSSIIGNDAILTGVFHSYNLGDSAEVNYETP